MKMARVHHRGLSIGSALAALVFLSACERVPDMRPLPAVVLGPAETEALKTMNTAGTRAFAGWTWRYEFGAGCMLRIIKRYEGEYATPVMDHHLIGHQPEIISYHGDGFGVKAYLPNTSGSVDLFDTNSMELARSFSEAATQLISSCDKPPAK